MRVRVVLAVGLALTAILFAWEMSGSASRTDGSDHGSPRVFSASVPGGKTVCQPVDSLPADVRFARVVAGTDGQLVPAMRLRFINAAGASVAEGKSGAGNLQGYVTFPLARRPQAGSAVEFCLRVYGSTTVRLAGQYHQITSRSEVVNGVPRPGIVSLQYARAGGETWWQYLPALSRRFDLGKVGLFGMWTLAAMALLLLVVWIAAVGLLDRELR